MNFTTQAAQDILGKIERDPAELRHWRQLLILCFDQKAVDTLQVLQVIVAAIEQIWNHKRQLAKEAHEEAKLKQRATGNRDPLPSLAVLSIPLTVRQKETFGKLARNPDSPALLYRFGLHLEEDFHVPQAASTIYNRALSLDPDDEQLERKINDALERVGSQTPPPPAPAPVEKPKPSSSFGDVIAPESMGVKSPSHHRPSVSALIKRSGRLSLDRGRIQPGVQGTSSEVPWPDTQKKLDELMTRLLTRAATLCETAPRPMRLPRSIAPSQWLEFLESHVTLLLATLEAQEIIINPKTNVEEAPRTDVAARSALVITMMEEIERALNEATPLTKTVILKSPVKSETVCLEEIFELIEAGSFAEAETHLKEIDSSIPKEQVSEVWFHLGLAYQNNHETKKAVAAYQQARKFNPQNLQAWFNCGMIQHEEGMLQPALECYQEALELDPEQSKIWCNLGALQFQLGEFEQSVGSLNRAVSLKPDYARAWDNLAGSLCALDQLGEAERCCHRAINFKSEYADPFFKLGSIYFQQNRLDEAEKAFRKVLEWQPGYPLAGHYLAIVLARTQRLEEAMQICQTAATPPGEMELPALAWNEMAYNLYEKGQYAQAIRAYEKALAYTPERAVTWLDAGVAHHQLGNLEEAQYHYNQAVTLDPELARAWHNLGTVRHELGDAEGGNQALAEAERLLAPGR